MPNLERKVRAMELLIVVLAVLISLGVGIGSGLFVRSGFLAKGLERAREEEARIREQADLHMKSAVFEAKEEALKIRTNTESELKDRRSDLQRQERRVSDREENLERRADTLDKREEAQNVKDTELDKERSTLEEMKHQELEVLEKLSALSAIAAKDMLM